VWFSALLDEGKEIEEIILGGMEFANLHLGLFFTQTSKVAVCNKLLK